MSASPSPHTPEFLLLGCEGVGKSCLVRQLQRVCSEHRGLHLEADVNLAAAPTNGVERDELVYGAHRCVVKEIGGAMKTTWSSYWAKCSAILFIIDVANAFQLAESIFEFAALMYNQALALTPIVLILNKMSGRQTDTPRQTHRARLPQQQNNLYVFVLTSLLFVRVCCSDAAGALSRSELQTAVRLDDILSSARGGAATATETLPPLVLECSATQPAGITQLMEQIVRMSQEIQKSK